MDLKKQSIKEISPFISILQSLAIFLVVLGHAEPSTNTPPPVVMQWLHSFIYSFHMHLFMFISGYLYIIFTVQKKQSYGELIKSKAIRLLMPFIFLNTLAFLIKNVLANFAQRPIEPSIIFYLKSLTDPDLVPIIYFWFLPTLFIIFLVAPIFKFVIDKNAIPLLLFLGALFTITNIYGYPNVRVMYINSVTTFLIFFFSGCIFGHFNCLKSVYNQKIILFLSLIILIGASFTHLDHTPPDRSIALIVSFSGIIWTFYLAEKLLQNKSNLFAYIEGYSYQIFLFSWFYSMGFKILYQLHLYNYATALFLRIFAVMALCVISAKMIKKLPRIFRIFVGL